MLALPGGRKRVGLVALVGFVLITLICGCGVSGYTGITSLTVAPPAFTPTPGTPFSSTLAVSLSESTAGATIYYTTNGSIPSPSSSLYSGPFNLAATTTVRAMAVNPSGVSSVTASATYPLASAQVATTTPTFTPAGGSFSNTVSVSLADATPGAAIHYTTDGSAPSASSPVYAGAIPLSATTTVNAIAIASGFAPSAVGTATYTLNAPTLVATATPTFTPASGNSFSSTLSVSIADTTPGAAIHYTTDGSAPSASSAVYSGPLTLSTTTVVNAIAVTPGFAPSAIATAGYTLNAPAATPIFSPASGTAFSNTLGVTITDTTPGAAIHYTIDGSVPGASSPVYAGPLTLSATTTVNAIAIAAGFAPSAIVSANYTLNAPAATPMFNPASGTTFSNTLSVTIADTTAGATIHYTTNGSAPVASSPVYAGPLTLSATTTVNAIAIAAGFAPSAIVSANYTLNPPAATPIFSPASGTTFSNTLSVTIADTTSGATIHYTTNGSAPSASSPVYAGPITLSATTTVNAIAIASGFAQSSIASANYTLNPPATTPIFSPASGTTFSNTLSVTIADTTVGAAIHYTTDGSAPGASSPVYSGPITLSATATVNAIAIASGFAQSSIVSASYTLNPRAATPILSPASGTTFSNTLSVTIADMTPGAAIHYTTDGSAPGASSPVYAGPITLNATTTVNAIAIASGFAQSAIASANYSLNPPAATPIFSPPSGTTFSNTLSVTIADATPAAAIHYTTDGSAPSASSLVYSGPITLSATTTVNAIAIASGFAQSAIASANYSLNAPAATPAFNPASGTTFSSTLSVTIADATPGAAIHYTTNGSAPSASSPVYSGPITLSATTTVNAIAIASGFAQSGIASANYTLNAPAATPTFNPASGTTFSSTLSVTIADATPGAAIHYTTNGSAPSASSPVYSGPITLSATTTVNAIAIASGFAQSGIASANYTLNAPAATPTFNPASGTTFSNTLSVSIADATPAATIHYTTDGTGPSASSPVYSGPITLSATTTVNAIAIAAGFAQSAVATASYTRNAAAATPTFNPSSGTTFSNTLSVSIADATPAAAIHYTTNGTAPSGSSPVYNGPITLSATTTVNAIAIASGFAQSAVGTASYTLSASTGGVVSDNFDEPALNTSLWTTENPLGDGIVTMNGTGVTLTVPQGTIHDLQPGADNSLRVVQPISNSDFSVDVRFQSVPESGNQDEGILVEQDPGDFVRFDVLFNGTVGLELNAAGISGGTLTPFIAKQIALPVGPVVLRLAREGNVWTPSWSKDGISFTALSSFTFSLNAAFAGPYVGSYATTAYNSPSFTAIADYFFATSEPIANQDGPEPYSYATVDANPPGTLVEKVLIDIEGTGKLEPVIGTEQYSYLGNNSNGGIYWYSYPTSGGANGTWTRHTIVANGNAYEDMATFDVNHDGAADLIASYDNTSGVYQIVWFENPRGSGGDPTQPWVEHVIGPGYGENNLTLGDIDGDGKLDVITPSSVFFQNSADSWSQMKYAPSFRGVSKLDIGSGLGSINLVGTGPSPAYNLVWYENPRETGGNARTGAWAMHTIASTPYPCQNSNQCTDSGFVAAYNAMDVDGDEKMDVISSQSEGPHYGLPAAGGLIWWEAPSDRRNGSWIKHTIDAKVIDVHNIGVGDMDKNGTADIVVAEQDQSPERRVLVYYNDGQGNLTPQIISNVEGHNVWLGDVTGSGSLDILNSGHGYFDNAHPLQIFLNPN